VTDGRRRALAAGVEARCNETIFAGTQASDDLWARLQRTTELGALQLPHEKRKIACARKHFSA